jgi:hypothetical protein
MANTVKRVVARRWLIVLFVVKIIFYAWVEMQSVPLVIQAIILQMVSIVSSVLPEASVLQGHNQSTALLAMPQILVRQNVH